MAKPNNSQSRYGTSTGIQVGLRLRPVIAEQLYTWLKHHNISRPVKPEGMRVIVTSSAKKVPGWSPKGDSMHPIVVHPSKAHWALFGPRNNILILQIASPEIERRYYQLRNQGFRSKTNLHLKPGFTPYLVIALGFNGSVESLPSFTGFPRDLIFDRESAEPIQQGRIKRVEKAAIEDLEDIINEKEKG